MVAIGFAETRGLIDNIKATDVTLKVADVELVGTDIIGASLVTVVVIREVGAVKAATEAGAEIASRVGEPLAVHVVPRPHADTAKIPPKPDPVTK